MANERPWKVLLIGCGSMPLIAKSASDLARESEVPATLHRVVALEANIVYCPAVVLNKSTGDVKSFDEIAHQPLVNGDDMVVYGCGKWPQNL
jgi:hypothetical protein